MNVENIYWKQIPSIDENDCYINYKVRACLAVKAICGNFDILENIHIRVFARKSVVDGKWMTNDSPRAIRFEIGDFRRNRHGGMSFIAKDYREIRLTSDGLIRGNILKKKLKVLTSKLNQ